ncbi:MAG: ArnT family glycosyltransferase [Mangrovibacterium sp.]
MKYRFLIILGIDLILFVFRLSSALHDPMPLKSDEAQYWLWSRHLDWSYYSKPPLIAWVNYLSTMLLGNTVIGIRINAMLIGFMLPLIHYALAKRLFQDEKVIFWSVIVLFVLPHYHFISGIFMTDSLVLLFWSLNMLLCLYALQKNKLIYWVLSGVTLGLGIISKYTMILWVPVFVLVGLICKRNLLRLSGFRLSLFIAFLICLPVLIWNLSQDFVGAKHIFGLAGAYRQHGNWGRSVERIIEYVGGQILCISPFFVPACYRVYKKWKNKELNPDHQSIGLLFVPLLAVWAFFLVLSIQKNEVNWTFFAFTSLPLLIGYSLVRYFNMKQRLVCTGITALLVFMIHSPWIFDSLGLTKMYPPEIDMCRKQTAWDKLGGKVTDIMKGKNSDNIFIFSDSYHVASELSFYVDGNPQTYCVNNGRRMNQFDIWPGIDQFENKQYDAIYVSYNPLPESISMSSDEIRFVSKQERIYRGKKVKADLNIYYLKNFHAIDEKQPTKF